MARAYTIINLDHPTSILAFPAVPFFSSTHFTQDRRIIQYNKKSVVMYNDSVYKLISFFSLNTKLFAIAQKLPPVTRPPGERFLTVTFNHDEDDEDSCVILMCCASKPLVYYEAAGQQVYYILDESA